MRRTRVPPPPIIECHCFYQDYRSDFIALPHRSRAHEHSMQRVTGTPDRSNLIDPQPHMCSFPYERLIASTLVLRPRIIFTTALVASPAPSDVPIPLAEPAAAHHCGAALLILSEAKRSKAVVPAYRTE